MSASSGRVLLAVTGSIAAFKAAVLAGDLLNRGHDVRVILTPAGARFVAPLTFEGLTHHRVATEMWDEGGHRLDHLELARWPDILVVSPASADAIARLALGLADSMLGAVALAYRGPIVVTPAMETAMYQHPATQHHLQILRSRGVTILGPESGRLASGQSGEGRMVEPTAIVEEIERVLAKSGDLIGRRVLVTAGPTREVVDPIRYLGNRSSGRMGYALAAEAAARGADVTLVSGPTHLPEPRGVKRVDVESTEEMRAGVLTRASGSDVLVLAAAVADFRPGSPSTGKLKRGPVKLELVPTPDIAAEAAKVAPHAFRVGFALETEHLLERAREKLARKQLDLIVANQVTADHNPLGSATNRVTLVTASDEIDLPEMPKEDVARAIWDAIVPRLASSQ